MARRASDSSSYRKVNLRSERKRILLFALGKTECQYFNDLKTDSKIRQRFQIDIVDDIQDGIPEQIVQLCLKRSKKHETRMDKYDFVAVAFDYDNEDQLDTKRDNSFCNVCSNPPKGIQVLFSNPCLETWFALHFTASGLSHSRKSAISHCESLITGYHKGVSVWHDLEPRQRDAVTNAIFRKQFHTDNNTRLHTHQYGYSSLHELYEFLHSHL